MTQLQTQQVPANPRGGRFSIETPPENSKIHRRADRRRQPRSREHRLAQRRQRHQHSDHKRVQRQAQNTTITL